MHTLIISDTSCLIALGRIGRLEILQSLFGSVLVTSIVAAEYGNYLPAWIEIMDPRNQVLVREIAGRIDEGEASSIVLATETQNSKLIVDDLPARRIAKAFAVNIIGTLGVLIEAKKQGILPSLRDAVDALQTAHFYLSADLVSIALRDVGE